jgi:predicted metalloprotease with PDZ domain
MLSAVGGDVRWGIATFVLASMTVADSATAEPIRYAVAPVVDGGELKAIAIEMVLAGEGDGETAIELPSAWGGKGELWRGVSEFRVSGKGLKVTAGGNPAQKIIRHAPGATLTVRYRLTQFWTGEPTITGSNEYRPVVRKTYFHFIGHTAFAHPNWSLATPVTVTFRDMPSGWRLASDLEHKDKPLRLAELLESVSVGGDFRVAKAGKLRVAIRGKWPFSDQAFIDRLKPIVASHRKFWGDAEEPFLVTVLPLASKPGSMSLGGTGLGDAFAFFGSTNAESGEITRTLAHEHLHTWIPHRVGTMPQQDDAADYWLSEGFTDFYTNRLLLRDGAWTLEDAASAYDDVMWAYAFSPARNVSNGEIVKHFWSDPHVNKLPYQRGMLLAALWDHRVRQASKGAKDLDDVVRGMKEDAAAAGANDLPPPARELFIANMQRLGVDVTADIARFVEKGETIVLPGDLWPACGAITTSDVAEFDRGFDGWKTIASANAVRGVDPKGPAYAAGLRDNMRLLKLDLGEGGDSREPLVYRVADGAEVREIRYLPEGKRRVAVQEFRLKTLDEAGRKACAAQLAGDN